MCIYDSLMLCYIRMDARVCMFCMHARANARYFRISGMVLYVCNVFMYVCYVGILYEV